MRLLGFDLRRACRCGEHRIRLDVDFARLHGLGNFPNQIDGQQAVRQIGARYPDMVGQFETVLERTAGDAVMQVAFALRLALVADDGQKVRLERQVEIVLREAPDRNGDAVGIVARLDDVIGRNPQEYVWESLLGMHL
jgi:hypothetical protein